MFRFQRIPAFVSLLMASSVAGDAGATSLVRFAFDSLCVQAASIAYVRCAESRSFLDEERGEVVTRTRLEVLASIKGDPGGEIVLTLPGGEVDGRGYALLGVPRFRPGDERVVFLSGEGAHGSPWPIGLGQGCYRVGVGKDGGVVVSLQAGVTPLPEGAAFKPSSHRRFEVPLQSFLDRIRQVLSPPPGEL